MSIRPVQRLQRQRQFLLEGKGNLMVFAEFREGRHTPEPHEIPGQSNVLSEEFLQKHAYDLGVQQIRSVKARAKDALELGDDFVPPIIRQWGSGASAAQFTGGDVIFEEITSYSTGPVLKDWSDLDRLKLSTDNRWFDYILQFWRGVFSEYEEGLASVMFNYRTPLDYANDYRGNDLFTDLYDYPDELHQLLGMITDTIIECDTRLRHELPEMNSAPGGAWGVSLGEPGMLFLNGDPIDLIRVEHGEEFNTPYVEKLIDYAGSLYFHHHSIGVSRAPSVAKIKGLTVQQIHQDPNGPRLCDCIDDDLIAASTQVPIHLYINLHDHPDDLDALLEELSQGRFIVLARTRTSAEARELVQKVRRHG